jgi:hypothetical protein
MSKTNTTEIPDGYEKVAILTKQGMLVIKSTFWNEFLLKYDDKQYKEYHNVFITVNNKRIDIGKLAGKVYKPHEDFITWQYNIWKDCILINEPDQPYEYYDENEFSHIELLDSTPLKKVKKSNIDYSNIVIPKF